MWFGLAFGCVLLVFGFGSAGMGHGTYLPLAIYGAPLSIIPILGMFIAPVWWAAMGWVLSSRRRRTSVVMLILHMIAVGLFLWFGTPTEQGEERWTYFVRAEHYLPLWLWGGISTYVAGLLVAWTVTILRDQ
jgi:hypothetical protein